ncbi:alpha-mannosidase [Thalassobacillus devorans]|uniref:Alpha-mannosidase n=1 Tax=Thalassobacillus devorans TaxID=279813 RepID=A0ABQ1P247_9BACI|nr:glycoside hydrolase family 38 C-terminal domain-containing protein [Thalassobacillus devorans]NIK28007.1 mannosylglycerate hydrolase [Thalassobacillus devorans]GGC89643.1 alpha-mannosidase [Thalassobacillus devorans]
MNFHLISHTHWDREWHQTYQQYRVKLVRFMDELIQLLEGSPEYSSFMLDGQTIVLEDYLEIKPEKREAIVKLVQKGQLLVGPWYIQPDEFIPSGESLIRNLLIGQQIADEFGQAMKIGYLPDSFGQSAQIPQVLNGFGINYALFWRGITEEETANTDFWWEGLDGSKVLTTHLPLGYGNGRDISTDHKQNVKVIEQNLSDLKDKVTSENMLVMCGFDQRTAIKELPEIVAQLNEYYSSQESDHAIKLSQLKEYFDSVEKEAEKLETIRGEFRKGKNMRVHVSIASTRLDLKRENYDVQNLYENYLEPLNAMSFLVGNSYDNALINQGWKYTLQNHAHDSICNVCTDATHKEMEMRYLFAKQIGETIQNDTITDLLTNVDFDFTKGSPIIVFNTLAHKRKNVVDTTIQLNYKNFTIVDSNGNSIPYQIVETKQENLNDKQIEIGVKNEDQYVWTTRIKFLAELEGLGYKTFYINETTPNQQETQYVYEDKVFSNDFFQVEIQPNGALRVKDHSTNKVYDNLNILEESGNAGDEYDFSPPKEDKVITTHHSIPEVSVVQNGPIFATVKVTHTLNVPIDTNVDQRSKEKREITIESLITVHRHEDRIDIKTLVDNTVKNHRVRALFESGLQTGNHVAEQQFGMIRRDNYLPQVDYWDKDKWEEKYYPIYPQQKYVDISDSEKGISFLNKGLPQYEILNGDEPTVALTLLAGTDYMGKQDLLDRLGRRSGLHVETPDSSLLGEYEMEYAIVPHAGDELDAQVGRKADEYTTPMKAVQVNGQSESQATYKENEVFFQVDHPHVALSAVKKCEYDDSIIVRIYNTTTREIPAVKTFVNAKFFDNVTMVDLNEKPLTKEDNRVQYKDGRLNINNIASNEIISFKLSK